MSVLKQLNLEKKVMEIKKNKALISMIIILLMLVSCKGNQQSEEGLINDISEIKTVIIYTAGYDENHTINKYSTDNKEINEIIDYINGSVENETDTSNVRIGGGRNLVIIWNDGKRTKFHIEEDNMVVNDKKYFEMNIDISKLVKMTDLWEDYNVEIEEEKNN